jgi:hypothetical protein
MTMRKADGDGIPEFERAGIVRTARPLLAGVVHVLGPECRLGQDELSAV